MLNFAGAVLKVLVHIKHYTVCAPGSYPDDMTMLGLEAEHSHSPNIRLFSDARYLHLFFVHTPPSQCHLLQPSQAES
jgi:hypothetical protein